MTIIEMIRKWDITIADTKDGQEGLRLRGKPTPEQLKKLKEAKPAILVELHQQETERAAAYAKKKAADEAENQALVVGEKPIVCTYHDGEYLSGYEVFGQDAKLLEALGLARYVDGWGYHVPSAVVNVLGTEFTYPAALEYTRPAREAKAAKEAARAAERAAKFQQARETGKRVEISRYSTECNDPREECSMDIVTVWAMPDGMEKTTRQHTW